MVTCQSSLVPGGPIAASRWLVSSARAGSPVRPPICGNTGSTAIACSTAPAAQAKAAASASARSLSTEPSKATPTLRIATSPDAASPDEAIATGTGASWAIGSDVVPMIVFAIRPFCVGPVTMTVAFSASASSCSACSMRLVYRGTI
jgi:hypothetical protein